MATNNQQPITAARFATALESLPIDALHAKASEIQNSIAQLKASNEQMLPFADQGDADCREAMFENLGVMSRFNERVGLIRAEVERRGLPWEHSGEGEGVAGAKVVNGVLEEEGEAVVVGRAEGGAERQLQSGRLTDEELRRRMEERTGGAGGQEDEGVHL